MILPVVLILLIGLSDMKVITDLMKELGIPMNRDNYLDLVFNGDTPDPVPAEVEAELPENMRLDTEFITDVDTVTDEPLRKFTTADGTELIRVGDYNLTTGGNPPYGKTALLVETAADAFAEMNSAYRAEFEKDLVLESAYRDEDHNKKVKGADDSLHMQGLSIDIANAHCKEWVIKNGEQFGWFYHPYSGDSNHFNYGVQK